MNIFNIVGGSYGPQTEILDHQEAYSDTDRIDSYLCFDSDVYVM